MAKTPIKSTPVKKSIPDHAKSTTKVKPAPKKAPMEPVMPKKKK